ncbi:Similar to GPI transamidase component GAA1; acc. no. P39012 [Pyronema omphalodes CBS 100304]|uniref:Similar to GPI transamidase component GAA1 acc. no. P39012 n=1 Tax=Pyronema omphalodes (strain CBS 100304) TaxID=1076935 RepID=U4L0F6_PYROM|nr:Similar to GPI transamidase component GAA1; acc. no. P39012 [Pyronema omphalodes CBS 100304]
MALPRPLRSTALLRFLPLLSSICILIGVAWLLLLPLDEYSRNTYISENALLPGGVHTYFHGSEQNVFRAYRHEVAALGQQNASTNEVAQVIGDIFKGQGLKVGTQKFKYEAGGRVYEGENVYAVLEAPRGDATEAVVLAAPWLNTDEVLNESGVALVMALARYFKRWSLWSKDVIFLITSDARAGPQAWVDAYHDTHTPPMVESLPVTSGALQGVIVLDYPTAAPWDRIHIVYDGTNGQLPNLDLFNTAVHIAGNQMGVRTSLQELHGHTDSYEDRLRTMLRGMVNQGLGHATGPHSVFIPYHIDAITLQVSGFGNHDEVTMGRIVESLFRSLNNLLEHFHQSFFFYLLLGSKKFVSIGTYLPSAMLIAVNFTIMAIGLWLKSGTKPKTVDAAVAITEKPSDEKNEKKDTEEKEKKDTTSDSSPLPPSSPHLESPRPLLLPLLFLLLTHTLSTIPLLLFNTLPHTLLCPAFTIFSLLSLCLPLLLSFTLHLFSPTPQVYTLLRCFSLLSLGLFLSALATLNFSLSFLIGLGAVPVTFIKPTKCKLVAVLQHLVLAVANPMVALVGVAVYMGEPLGTVLGEAQVGWEINGLWTAVVVWGVWWPAWVVAGVGAWGGGRMVEN